MSSMTNRARDSARIESDKLCVDCANASIHCFFCIKTKKTQHCTTCEYLLDVCKICNIGSGSVSNPDLHPHWKYNEGGMKEMTKLDTDCVANTRVITRADIAKINIDIEIAYCEAAIRKAGIDIWRNQTRIDELHLNLASISKVDQNGQDTRDKR